MPRALHAELVRVDDDTWLDILTWSQPDGVEILMANASGLTALAEMHSLLEQLVDEQFGEVVHTTRA